MRHLACAAGQDGEEWSELQVNGGDARAGSLLALPSRRHQLLRLVTLSSQI
jgi:hypothetical protein